MNKLLPAVLDKIKRDITNQNSEYLKHFGEFNTPKIIELALSLIDEEEVNIRLEEGYKKLKENLDQFVGVDSDVEICSLVSDYYVLDILKQAERQINNK